ncbi:hypothetical protein LIER_18332 [Lithospermum erythrorhizon]|uniref:Outer envelope pore protein 24 n=1 Tax=Lithospermum erythrorhizon TaxID=34254 RepID=A0AAV3QHQ4_LITER
MIIASLAGRVDGDVTGLAGTVTVNGGDMKLRATVSDTSIQYGPSLSFSSISLEKPGSFIVDFIPQDKDVRFQFMNTARVMDKPLNLTYTHSRGANKTVLDGSLVIDPANKVSLNHAVGSNNFRLKYNYLHKGNTTFEPTYDFSKNAWDLAVSQRVFGDDVVRASYQSSSKILGLEYRKMRSVNGSFKVSASVNLSEPSKFPKLSGESTLSFEM